MAGKLIETVSGIGGCMLEAATWLRGIRTVKTQIEVNDLIYLKNLLEENLKCNANFCEIKEVHFRN